MVAVTLTTVSATAILFAVIGFLALIGLIVGLIIGLLKNKPTTGPQGPDGPQGFQGNLGAAAFPAAPGPQGPLGFTGIAAANGARGPQGTASEIQGPQGLNSIGPRGPQGVAGEGYSPQGPQGSPNTIAGPQSAPTRGPQGVSFRGPQGPPGNDTAPGTQGPIGYNGARGPQGPQGYFGTTVNSRGPQGVIGAVGANGNSIEGPEGYSGDRGPQGDDRRGPQGDVGLRGVQGPIAAIGLTGPSGDANTTPGDIVTIFGPPVNTVDDTAAISHQLIFQPEDEVMRYEVLPPFPSAKCLVLVTGTLCASEVSDAKDEGKFYEYSVVVRSEINGTNVNQAMSEDRTRCRNNLSNPAYSSFCLETIVNNPDFVATPGNLRIGVIMRRNAQGQTDKSLSSSFIVGLKVSLIPIAPDNA